MNTSHTATPEAQTAGLAAIRLSGADAETFLQGQLTQDITRITPDSPQLAGWTNAKGRLLCIFTALSWQKDIWLILPSALRDSVQKEQWLEDGSWACVVEVPGGMRNEIISRVANRSSGLEVKELD